MYCYSSSLLVGMKYVGTLLLFLGILGFVLAWCGPVAFEVMKFLYSIVGVVGLIFIGIFFITL